MNIYLNIERLIAYAKIHLLLDEADEIYARNLIMQKLGLSDYEAYEIDEEVLEGAPNPFELLDKLFEYAVQNGICKESGRKLFYAQIMDVLSLRPGQMEDMFDSLNFTKALEWAYDYAIKSGASFAGFVRWENKGDKNIEAVFTDGCGCSNQKCCMCIENEGFGVHRNERFISLPIGGEWYYKTAKKAYFEGMGHIVSAEHKPLVIGKELLDAMFDFIEAAPTYFICTGESEKANEHAHLICGATLLPIHKANDARKFKSKEYPYIDITVTDWYTTGIRLACTNRGKLIEFTLKLINAYKKDGGKVFISLRKVESKFVIELGLMRGEAKKENSALTKLDIMAMAGVFGISSKTEAELKTIEKYLTKEIKFTPACLTDGMEAHAKMIDRLLKEVGNDKLGSVEAALDVKEECKKTLVAFLTDIKAFDDKQVEGFIMQF